MENEACVCLKSPTGKHELLDPNYCQGSWHHDDQGGTVYEHKTGSCKHCGLKVCDFSQRKAVSVGWY